MTTTTAHDSSTTPSRTPLLAAFGIAASAVLTAMGTFWDVTDNSDRDLGIAEYLITLGIVVVAAALVFGLVVRGAESGNPGRRAAVLGGAGVLSVAAFWSGVPMVLVAAAVACALLERDRQGSFGTGSKAGLTLSALVTAAAVTLAVVG